MNFTAIDLKNLVTGTPVRTGCLLSARQVDDLKRCAKVRERHIAARMESVSGTVREEISGIRGPAFLVDHRDDDGMLNGTVGAYFACELFPPH